MTLLASDWVTISALATAVPVGPGFAEAAESVRAHHAMTVDVLYGDHEGGPRTVTRFGFMPRGDEDWLVAGARHGNVDRDDPR